MISVQSLGKRFPTPNGGEIAAVDDVAFDVAAGEVFGLLGPNGAGKTTTLRMMLGLLPPSAGDAFIDGFSIRQQPLEIKKRVGFVSTSVGVYQWLTAQEMLAFVADLYEVPQELAEERINKLAELLDFRSLLHRRCGVLSTGQKQRINLARALIHDPPAMLLDEPTQGLDIAGSQVVFRYIRHLQTIGKAVVLCTHRLDEAERFADRFGMLHHGRLQYMGDLPELQNETGHSSLTDMFIDLLERDPAERSS